MGEGTAMNGAPKPGVVLGRKTTVGKTQVGTSPGAGFWRRLPRAWKLAVAVGGVLGTILATAGVGWAARILYTDRAAAADLDAADGKIGELADDVAELRRQADDAAAVHREQAADLKALGENVAELKAGVRILIDARGLGAPKGKAPR